MRDSPVSTEKIAVLRARPAEVRPRGWAACAGGPGAGLPLRDRPPPRTAPGRPRPPRAARRASRSSRAASRSSGVRCGGGLRRVRRINGAL